MTIEPASHGPLMLRSARSNGRISKISKSPR